jgi:molybdopterin-biosynthesis enzyme MoeA-like protein
MGPIPHIPKQIKIMFKKLIDYILNGKQTQYTLLSLSIDTFTNESHLSQIQRQGRLVDFIVK